MKLLVFAMLLAGAYSMPANLEGAEEVANDTTTPAHRTGPEDNFAYRRRLQQELFRDYDRKLYPDQPNIEMSVTLMGFEVSAEKNRLDSDIWLSQQWRYSRLTWKEEDFGGIPRLRIPEEEVWLPDVTLYNTPDEEHRLRCWNPNVMLSSNGTILRILPCDVTSICKFHLTSTTGDGEPELDGEQTCTFKFGSWTYDGWTMDLNMYKNATGIDISVLNKNPKYGVVSTSAQRNENFYDCCKEPYLDLTFNLTIKAV